MNITIKKQRRSSLALQLTPKGIRVLIPNQLEEDDTRVQNFIDRALTDLPDPPQPIGTAHPPEKIHELVTQWAKTLSVDVQRVQIREMTTKWGSISTAGYLTLADTILWLPLPLVEYVIVHELMHLKFSNHDKGWQASMGMYLSDWKLREKQLQSFSFTCNPFLNRKGLQSHSP